MAGCCANMVGFAVLSFRENRWGGLVSQGIGTSMLQMPNIVKNPRIWLPAILTSAVTGPLATCFFKLEMNGDPINSGMGTCGLCGQLGVWTGWVSPSDAALANGAAAIVPTAFDWAGLILISFVLPAVLTWALRPVLPEDRLDQGGGPDPGINISYDRKRGPLFSGPRLDLRDCPAQPSTGISTIPAAPAAMAYSGNTSIREPSWFR